MMITKKIYTSEEKADELEEAAYIYPGDIIIAKNG